MTTFDGDTLTITLGAPTDGALAVDAEVDLYSDWKDWVLLSDNIKYPPAFRVVGGDALTPGIDAGAYFFLRNDYGWRIKPHESDHTVYLTGNLTPQDSSLPIMIPTTGGYTVLVDGLQPITQNIDTIKDSLEFSLFDNGVTVDVTSSYSGTGTLVGTGRQPVNNIPDAITIAEREGFNRIYIRGNITLDTGDIVDDYLIIGDNANHTTITVNTGASTTGTEFRECTLTGTLDGGAIVRNAVIDTLNYVDGIVFQSMINSTTLTLSGTGTAHFLDCYSGVPGTGTPTIDFSGSGSALAMRGYKGGIKLTNKTGTDSATIDLDSGQIRLDPSAISGITNGTIVCRGDGKVVNHDTDELIASGTSTLNGATILNETNYTINVETKGEATLAKALSA